MLRPFVLALSLATASSASPLPQAADAEDARIFQAVLQHTVRTFVVSFSNRMDAPPPPLLVLDVTMPWCPIEGGASSACLDRERVESALRSVPAPPELTASFRNRNAARVALRGNLGPDLVSIPHDAVQESLRAWYEQATATSRSRSPATPVTAHSCGSATCATAAAAAGCSRSIGWAGTGPSMTCEDPC